MNRKILRYIGMSMLLIIMNVFLAGCQNSVAGDSTENNASGEKGTETADAGQAVPKYVFLFIGDGMSYPQVETTNYYLAALENGTSMGSEDAALVKEEDAISFVNFPVVGSAQTYSSTSFCPDSASTATAIASGHKTYSGVLNMDETGTVSYETISEKLRDQLGYKIGIVTSVNLNHATPAAFYAHQATRSNYYEIGQELISSNFDYFAGGNFLSPEGEEGNQTNLCDLAEEAGYTVVKTQDEAEAVNSDTGRVILIDEHLTSSDTFPYEIDREDDEWALSDYVSKGIECLYDNNEEGFFMMVEGGKIDWACHANDAATTIADTKALSDAVGKAVEFYKEHPDETLILVTGDHETGGLSIGYAGTNYDTFLQNLNNQKISFQKFNDDYVAGYRENGTGFKDVMKDITKLFGLVTEKASGEDADDSVVSDETDNHTTGVLSGNLVLTDSELEELKEAYENTMDPSYTEDLTQEEYELYGSYEPLTVTITHILNNKSGIAFTSYSHTGLPAAVFAEGTGSEKFTGYYDNTDICKKMTELMGVE